MERRIIKDQVFNYIVCPSLCRSCVNFYTNEDDSIKPEFYEYECVACSTDCAATKVEAMRFESLRTFDTCARYEKGTFWKMKKKQSDSSSTSDDSSEDDYSDDDYSYDNSSKLDSDCSFLNNDFWKRQRERTDKLIAERDIKFGALDEMYETAVRHYHMEQYSDAVSLFIYLAEKGYCDPGFFTDCISVTFVGDCYFKMKEYAKAVEWFHKDLDRLTDEKHGKGDANNVLYKLGCCYQYGYGVAQNIETAEEYYYKSAKYNPPIYQDQSGDDAFNALKELADQGRASAKYYLGNCFYQNESAKHDDIYYNKAVEWFRKAAEQGYAKAQNALGDCYYFGEGVKKNYAVAVEWFRKAADQGLAEGLYSLGFCYDKGKGLSKDHAKAAEFMRKSADKGNGSAKKWINGTEWASQGLCWYCGGQMEGLFGKKCKSCKKPERNSKFPKLNENFCNVEALSRKIVMDLTKKLEEVNEFIRR